MEKRLERDQSNKMLAGVAAGLAGYLNMEVTWIRVLFLILAFFGFTGVWIYLILWIAVPAKPVWPVSEAEYRMPEQKTGAEYYPPFPQPESRRAGRLITGSILMVLGICLLVNEFVDLPEWLSLSKLWPLAFVAIGLIILLKPGRKNVEFNKSQDNPPAERTEPKAPAEDSDI
ncbi:PspC domain-containing protein [Desertivirga xinjiangensis]|uniref:PspC domain-containing protein n=1 Tax=Desertivirga xinjiangensis TaxID=539206 RepID=UPI00210CAEE2|nr:PspC domain-containing protein [Pedobacter xinjiangensis]